MHACIACLFWWQILYIQLFSSCFPVATQWHWFLSYNIGILTEHALFYSLINLTARILIFSVEVLKYFICDMISIHNNDGMELRCEEIELKCSKFKYDVNLHQVKSNFTFHFDSVIFHCHLTINLPHGEYITDTYHRINLKLHT